MSLSSFNLFDGSNKLGDENKEEEEEEEKEEDDSLLLFCRSRWFSICFNLRSMELDVDVAKTCPSTPAQTILFSSLKRFFRNVELPLLVVSSP